jgi:hypothetical protein
MSLLQHPLLEKPLNNLNEFYLQEIVPRLTKKNKVIAITAAIVFLFSYKVNQVLRPPRRLRHLPHQGYFDFLASLFKRESPLERAQRYSLPLLSSEENNGLYLVCIVISLGRE